MTFDNSNIIINEFYWKIHYNNVNRSEVRMMKFDPKEDWAHFADRISKKINITADKAFPLRYYIGKVPNNNLNSNYEDGSISVDDDEDFSICSIVMKLHDSSKNPEKGFDLYTKQLDGRYYH